jgi:hypothetical protein
MTSYPVCIPATACRSEELHEEFTLIRRKLETGRPNIIIFIQGFHHIMACHITYGGLKTPWPESARELYRPNDSRLSAKLVPTFADRGCHEVSEKNPYGSNLGFPDRSR